MAGLPVREHPPRRGAVGEPRLGAGSAAEVPRAHPAAARLSPRDRLAVSALRDRGPEADPGRRARPLRARERAPGRDPGHLLPEGPRAVGHQDLPRPRDLRRPALDRHRVRPRDRAPLPGPRLPHARRRGRPPPRHLERPLRPRRGADRGPHQPLQHDVQPVLHGRQPGGLRPRADLRRREEDPGRLDLVQAAAADGGAVLRRRAHDVAALPRGLRLRQAGRLPADPGRDQRPALRDRARVRLPGEGGRARHGLPPVRRDHERVERPPPHHEPVRRAPDRDRQPGGGRHPHHAGGDGRERRQQPAGRPDLRLLPRQPRQDGRAGVPARLLHRPRRGGERRGAPAPALHDLAPGPRPRPLLRRQDRPLPRLVPARFAPRRSPPSPTT